MYKRNILRRLAICVLVLCMLMTCGLPAYAGWDGYVEKINEPVKAVDMNNLSTILGSNAIPSRKNTKKGDLYSAHWSKHTSTPNLYFRKGIPKDWTKYENVTFSVYSAKKTNAKLNFLVYCEKSYLYYSFYEDWEGWKDFELKIGEGMDLQPYNNADYTKVNYIQFNASGWQATANAESDVYITSIYLNPYSGGAADKLSDINFTMEQRVLFEENIDGMTAVYHYSPNVLLPNGDIARLKPEDASLCTEDRDGLAVAPVDLFGAYIGAKVSESDGKTVISLNGNSLTLCAGQTEYETGGEKKTFGTAPFRKGDTLYVPVVACCEALGMTAMTLDGLTLIGPEEQFAPFLEDARLVIMAQALIANEELDLSTLTAEDFREMKDNWRRYLVGDETNNLEDEIVQQVVARTDAAAKSAYDSLNLREGGDGENLFGGAAKLQSTNAMTNQYARVTDMAKAYGTYGSSLYHSETLKTAIFSSLEWLNKHLYGANEMEGHGWKSFEDYNWWDWHVGVPQQLVEILLIMEDDLTHDQITKYLAPYYYVTEHYRTGVGYADSRIYAETAAQLLEERSDRLHMLNPYFNYIFEVNKSNGLGIREDYSYIAHVNIAYNGAYGTDILDRCLSTCCVLAGTKLSIANYKYYMLAKLMGNMYSPFMYNGKMMSAVIGRDIDYGGDQEYILGARVVKAGLDMQGMFGPDEDCEFKELVKRNMDDKMLSTLVDTMSVRQATQLSQILSDGAISDEDETLCRSYAQNDRIVQKRNGYAVSISMSSSRIGNYECINGNNMKGWYTGDGMVNLYCDTERDTTPYGYSYWHFVNNYHMPGTTVDTQERQRISVRSGGAWLSSQDFVGSVDLNSLYGTAAMALESYHNDKPGNTSTNNGDLPQHSSTLTAKKSWFLLDNEVVALGADIQANDGFPVQTVVDNRKLNREVKIEGAEITESYEPVEITAAGNDGNIETNVNDRNYNTRWSMQGKEGCWLTLDLGEEKTIGYAGIAWYGHSTGSAKIFQLEVSSDGENWTIVYDGRSKEKTDLMEAFDMKGVTARYVRYNGHGSETGTWNSITEMHVYPPRADGKFSVDEDVNRGILPGAEDIIVDGVPLEKTVTFEKEYTDPHWIWLEDTGGYYFPDGGALKMQKTSGVSKFLELWFEHGVSPKNGNYAYVLLPNQTAEETKSYAANPDIAILSNTAALQAVADKRLGVTGMVFWTAGSCGSVRVSAPLIVMMEETDEKITLRVCDPTWKLENAALTISGDFADAEGDKEASFTRQDGSMKVDLSLAGKKGGAVQIVLTK